MGIVKKIIVLLLSVSICVSCVAQRNTSTKDPEIQPAPEPTPEEPVITNSLKRMSPDFDKSLFYFSHSTYVKNCEFHSYGTKGAIFRVESKTIDESNSMLIHEIYFADRCDSLYLYANYHLFYAAYYDLNVHGVEDGLIHYEYQFTESYLDSQSEDGVRLFMELEEARNCDVYMSYHSKFQSFNVSSKSHCFLQQDPLKIHQGHAYIDETDYSVTFNKNGEHAVQEENSWSFHYYEYYFQGILDIDVEDHHFYFTQATGQFEGMSAYYNPIGYTEYYELSNFPNGKYVQVYVNYNDNEVPLFKIEYDVTIDFQYSYTRNDVDRPIHDVKLNFESALLTPLSDAGLIYLNESNFCETTGITQGQSIDVIGSLNCTHKSKGYEYTYFLFKPEYNSFIIGKYREGYSSRDGSSPTQRYILEDNIDQEFMLNY
ncbi:MAG: hypothetical protein EP326_08125 [Deltaproteobacteria bacterium]|nr:MAG: hypothetical protein EP326_08125 [Deltaproteobacteria bacterium]